MDTLKELLAILGFGPENIQAVLYISLGSVFGTQVVKRSLPTVRGELVATALGALCGALLLSEYLKGALVGAVIGAFWSAMYKPLMRLAYKRWPDLEERVSAKPQQKVVQTPHGVEVRDITQPSAADERTLFVGSPTEPPGPSNE